MPGFPVTPLAVNTAMSGGLKVQRSSAAAASLILSAVPCKFCSAYCVGNSGAAGWLLVYDSATVPADGSGMDVVLAVPVASGGIASIYQLPYPHPCIHGCVIVFSSTGPYTQTTNSLTAQFLAGQVGGI